MLCVTVCERVGILWCLIHFFCLFKLFTERLNPLWNVFVSSVYIETTIFHNGFSRSAKILSDCSAVLRDIKIPNDRFGLLIMPEAKALKRYQNICALWWCFFTFCVTSMGTDTNSVQISRAIVFKCFSVIFVGWIYVSLMQL